MRAAPRFSLKADPHAQAGEGIRLKRLNFALASALVVMSSDADAS